MNESDEDDLGRTIAIAATNQWPLYDNTRLNKYVTMVGLTLADQTSNPGANWVFGVLDTPDTAAYSGPNGYIMITRGAIAAMQDESELAGVLAHEMSHVPNHDGFKAVKTGKISEVGTQGAVTRSSRRPRCSTKPPTSWSTRCSRGPGPAGNQRRRRRSQAAPGRRLRPHRPRRFLKRLPNASSKPFGTHPGTAKPHRQDHRAGPAPPKAQPTPPGLPRPRRKLDSKPTYSAAPRATPLNAAVRAAADPTGNRPGVLA